MQFVRQAGVAVGRGRVIGRNQGAVVAPVTLVVTVDIDIQIKNENLRAISTLNRLPNSLKHYLTNYSTLLAYPKNRVRHSKVPSTRTAAVPVDCRAAQGNFLVVHPEEPYRTGIPTHTTFQLLVTVIHR